MYCELKNPIFKFCGTKLKILRNLFSLVVKMRAIKIYICIFSLLLPLLIYGAPEITVVGDKLVDLGKYPNKETRKISYKIKNQGDDLLEIRKIRSTCGCTEVKITTRRLLPGKTADINVNIAGYGVTGVFKKHLFLETNDPKHRFFKLTFFGKAMPVFIVKPGNHLFGGRLRKNVKKSFYFSLIPTEKDCRLGEIITKSNYPVEASLVEKPGGRYQAIVSVTPEKNLGALDCKLFIPVTSPTGWKPIELHLTAKVGISLYAVPGKQVFTLPITNSVVKKFRLCLVGAQKNALKPEKISWDKVKGVEIAFGKTTANSINVTATFKKEFFAELSKKGKISIKFKFPDASTAQLDCVRRK